MIDEIVCGDALSILQSMPSESINCCITSPPYYGLRDYGIDGQIGLEQSPDEYIAKLVEIFKEVKRVLRNDGTLWLNIGDSYAGSWGNAGNRPELDKKPSYQREKNTDYFARGGWDQRREVPPNAHVRGCKKKDLIGIPWMAAFALRADGWFLRQDIIWCLSGGAKVYARTQKGDMPTSVKDLVRLDPKTVKLWNGVKWTQAVSWRENPLPEDPLEITLRSGERIGCTPDHVWPTQRGNVKTDDLMIGDKILTTAIPEPDIPMSPDLIPDDIGWFIGLYLAEGSRSNDCIQIAGHVKEEERRIKLAAIAQRYGANVRAHHGGGMKESINLYSKVLNAIIDTYLGGKTAKDKHLSNACWQRSNAFLKSLLDGYLSGDGGYDKANNRWRLGFTRNYYLEADLRTLCARLGYHLTIKPGVAKVGDKEYLSFKGEIRFTQSNHHNNKDMGEIVAIGESKGRKFWDIEVEDEPHLFALASGVLTHNCKPNCMPESVTDRCTKSHEYMFLLSKSNRYYFDNKSIQEPALYDGRNDTRFKGSPKYANQDTPMQSVNTKDVMGAERWPNQKDGKPMRNKRSIWTIATKPYKEAHFAVFPEKLIEPCILAGCPEGGIVLDPFIGSGTTGAVAKRLGRHFIGIDLKPDYCQLAESRIAKVEASL